MMHKNSILSFALPLAALASLSACGASDETREARLQAAGPNPDFAALMKVADAKVGQRKFMQCAGCHQIEEGGRDLGGPNLYGIYDQPTAQSSTRFGFTAALRDSGLKWDAETLDRWMQDPHKLVPATSMVFAGMADPLDRADVIAFIRSRSPQTAPTAP